MLPVGAKGLTMFCQYCGCAAKDSAKFCSNCGKPLGLHASALSAEQGTDQGVSQDADAAQPLGQSETTPADENTNAAESELVSENVPECASTDENVAASESEPANDDASEASPEGEDAPGASNEDEGTPEAENLSATEVLPAVSIATEQSSVDANTSTDAGANAPHAANPAPNANLVPPTFETPKKSNAALIAAIGVGAFFVLIALGVVLFAIPLIQGAKKASSGSETVITLKELDDRSWAYYLSSNVDKNDDGLISRREAELVTSIGDLSAYFTTGNGLCNAGVFDLEGIEYFTNLKVLLVYNNYLEKLDLSNNTKLRYLDCSENVLTELTLPDCDSLETVCAYGNLLSTLDVTNCPELDDLTVDSGVNVTGWSGDGDYYVYDGSNWLDYDYGSDLDDALDYDEYLDDLFGEDGNSENSDDGNNGNGTTENDSANADLKSA